MTKLMIKSKKKKPSACASVPFTIGGSRTQRSRMPFSFDQAQEKRLQYLERIK